MALEAVRARAPRLVTSTRQTEWTDPIDAFAAGAGAGARALWLRPTTGEALVAIDSAGTFSAEEQLPIEGGAVLIGGFAFDPDLPSSALWAGFGASRLVLPERLLRIQNDAAWLTTNTVTGPRSLPATPAPGTPPRTGLNPDQWRNVVAEVASGIRDGG